MNLDFIERIEHSVDEYNNPCVMVYIKPIKAVDYINFTVNISKDWCEDVNNSSDLPKFKTE